MNPPLSLLFIVLFLFALQTHVHAGVEHDVPNCAIPCGVRAASGAGCTPQCDCLEPCFIPWYVLLYLSSSPMLSYNKYLFIPSPPTFTFHLPPPTNLHLLLHSADLPCICKAKSVVSTAEKCITSSCSSSDQKLAQSALGKLCSGNCKPFSWG